MYVQKDVCAKRCMCRKMYVQKDVCAKLLYIVRVVVSVWERSLSNEVYDSVILNQ